MKTFMNMYFIETEIQKANGYIKHPYNHENVSERSAFDL